MSWIHKRKEIREIQTEVKSIKRNVIADDELKPLSCGLCTAYFGHALDASFAYTDRGVLVICPVCVEEAMDKEVPIHEYRGQVQNDKTS